MLPPPPPMQWSRDQPSEQLCGFSIAHHQTTGVTGGETPLLFPFRNTTKTPFGVFFGERFVSQTRWGAE